MESLSATDDPNTPTTPTNGSWDGLRRSLDPRPHLSGDGGRSLQQNFHTVIQGLRPLIDGQNMNLSSWLRNSSAQGADTAPRTNTRHINTTAQNAFPDEQDQDFVVSMDADLSTARSREGGNSGQLARDNTVGSPMQNGPNVSVETNVGHTDVIRQSPELRALVSIVEKYIPFFLILLAKLVFDHKIGLIVLSVLIITFAHANSIVKREVGKQTKRNIGSLSAIAMNLLVSVCFIYYVFGPERLCYSLVFLSPFTVHQPTFWDLLWAVTVTDFVLKLITMLFKIAVIILPANIIAYQRKGKYYLFIEQTSQLYRNFLPIHPWLIYLLEAYEGLGKLVGVVLCAAYIITKTKQSVSKFMTWKDACSKLMQNVSYGCVPPKDFVDVTGNLCPICQDNFKIPTMLHCKHIFCEECVSLWFDRERTCPMCRAQIADDPTWRDGSTTYFLHVF